MTAYGRPPKKGSKQRELLIAMLQPAGITTYEALERGLVPRPDRMHGVVRDFTDFKHWDVRMFPAPRSRCGEGGGRTQAYCVVGKTLKSGKYRSFVKP